MSLFKREIGDKFDWSKSKFLITPINGKVWLETEHNKPKDITIIFVVVVAIILAILFI
jgi:hypothetical protein